jgi:hypothetical protein
MFTPSDLRRSIRYSYQIDAASRYVFEWDCERTLYISIIDDRAGIKPIGTWTLSSCRQPDEQDALEAVSAWLDAEFGSLVPPSPEVPKRRRMAKSGVQSPLLR